MLDRMGLSIKNRWFDEEDRQRRQERGSVTPDKKTRGWTEF